MVYQHFYRYAMTICLHYAQNQEEAQEICNDAFHKVFVGIDSYSEYIPFKTWLRRVLINAAIDYHRKYHLRKPTLESMEIANESVDLNKGEQKLSLDDVMRLVQLLPPTYRLVFNLYEIEGFNHREIAEMLEISIGTSKSNLSKAKAKLRKILKHYE